MKILSCLLLIVCVLVCVQIAHAYYAFAITLRLVIVNTAFATIGNVGLENGTFNVYADVADCDPADSKQGSFANELIFSAALESGPLNAAGVANAQVDGFNNNGAPERDDDSDSN